MGCFFTFLVCFEAKTVFSFEVQFLYFSLCLLMHLVSVGKMELSAQDSCLALVTPIVYPSFLHLFDPNEFIKNLPQAGNPFLPEL